MKVRLIYFKSSGKYYHEAEYTSDKTWGFEVFEEVKQMKKDGKLPGLVEDATDFIIYIDPEDSCPALILISE